MNKLNLSLILVLCDYKFVRRLVSITIYCHFNSGWLNSIHCNLGMSLEGWLYFFKIVFKTTSSIKHIFIKLTQAHQSSSKSLIYDSIQYTSSIRTFPCPTIHVWTWLWIRYQCHNMFTALCTYAHALNLCQF